jgi:hypothetical protein
MRNLKITGKVCFSLSSLRRIPPWEPYSNKFAKQEYVAARVRHVSAISLRPKPSALLASKKEEKERLDEAKDEDEELFHNSRHPWDPDREARCIAVTSRWAQSGDAIELAEETTLATWLVAAMSLAFSTDTTVDGLELRPEHSLLHRRMQTM